MKAMQDEPPWYQKFALHPIVQPRLPRFWLLQTEKYEFAMDLRRRRAQQQLSALGSNAWPVVPNLLRELAAGTQLHRDVPIVEVLTAIRADEAPGWSNSTMVLRGRTQAAPALLHLLRGRNGFMVPYDARHRRFALIALAEIRQSDPSIAAAVTSVLQSREDHELWLDAARAWRRLGEDPAGMVAVVSAAALDPAERPEVRVAAMGALATGAPETPETLRILRECLGDEKSQVRGAAAKALWGLRGDAAEVLPALTELLRHRLRTIRVATLETLTEMGRAARPIVEEVERLITDDQKEVRDTAQIALKSIKAEGD